jgi:hypothetical protein
LIVERVKCGGLALADSFVICLSERMVDKTSETACLVWRYKVRKIVECIVRDFALEIVVFCRCVSCLMSEDILQLTTVNEFHDLAFVHFVHRFV